ncbi:zinc ribbon domain-containing protein [Sedimentitalea todarodis]|uniref:Zinc ribbon domain-containing protein n=1 Tax=Sedimentitalea todarodis TaxID=1631240 RepID=A0ABU3VM76_9RHOB|nr:zinc ribbon domain-containing protein [Sedimentitalea todarodis]MDU9007075.1 zinc ribbon domain-containing protein [Sedimentitalea todarodis]
MAKHCQSCGMPMKRDPNGGGTEADGSKSETYCSICYEEGAFRHPNVTVTEFQAHCVDALAKKGMPRIMAWAFTRGIPKLDRWTKAA